MWSRHLDEIITRHDQVTNLQVVFVDVERYSSRRTQNQVGVIRQFAECLKAALIETSKRYGSYLENNGLVLRDDSIVIPTGDGAAVAFTFDGLHDIHLEFALSLLAQEKAHRLEVCGDFESNGWCHCHSYFNVRLGIADGKAIVYRDVNANYNAAGSVVNDAAAILRLLDGNQIGFSADAFRQIVEMTADPTLAERFREYSGIVLKNGRCVSVYQYVDLSNEALNSNEPVSLMRDASMGPSDGAGRNRGADREAPVRSLGSDLATSRAVHP